jgi:hypothetical protein
VTSLTVSSSADQRGLRAVLAASWWLVRRPGLLVPMAAACALLLATAPALDDGHALQVLRGISVLLACALVASSDDPSGEVLAGSPYPRSLRTAARALAASAVIVPAWTLAAVLAQWRDPELPVLGAGVEALALGAVGLAIGGGLRSWRDLHAPSFLAALGVVGFAFSTSAAPRWYALQQGQTWGPPWEATQFRWLGLLLVALGIVVLAARDPLARTGHDLRPRFDGV